MERQLRELLLQASFAVGQVEPLVAELVAQVKSRLRSSRSASLTETESTVAQRVAALEGEENLLVTLALLDAKDATLAGTYMDDMDDQMGKCTEEWTRRVAGFVNALSKRKKLPGPTALPSKALMASCDNCQSSPALLRCSVCKTAYCSKECQVQGWPVHKRSCARLVEIGVLQSEKAAKMLLSGKTIEGCELITVGAPVNQQLLMACFAGRAAAVKLAIDQGANANCLMQPDEVSALLICAERGYSSAAKILLEAGAVVNFSSPSDGMSPLALAAQNNHIQLVRLLLEQPGIEINQLLRGTRCKKIDGGFNSALFAASYEGNAEVIELLLSAGAEVNMILPPTETCDASTALLGASLKLKRDAVCVLLKAKADPNLPPLLTPLLQVCAAQNCDEICSKADRCKIVQVLLQHKANVDAKDCNGMTALHHLVLSKSSFDSTILAMLLDAGADINAVSDSDGKSSPLAFACAKDGAGAVAVQALVNRGANLELAKCNGDTALQEAIASDSADCVDILIRAGVNVNYIFPISKASILHSAIVHGKTTRIARALLRAGAELKYMVPSGEFKGRTAFNMARKSGSSDMLQLICDAINNTRDASGNLPTVQLRFDTIKPKPGGPGGV